MGNIVIYIFLLGIIVLGFLFPRSKIIHILLISVCFSLFAFSYDSYDRIHYINEYNKVINMKGSEYEILYVWLMNISARFGLSFDSFRYLTAGITLVCLDFTTIRLCKNINVVWALYLIFSAMFDATIIRSSIAFGVTAIVLLRLITAEKKIDYLICGGLIFVSALIHSSYWILFLFIPAWIYLKRVDDKISYLIIILVSLVVVIYIGNSIFQVYGNLIIREATIDKYNTRSYSNIIGVVYNFLKYLIIISPVIIINKRLSQLKIKEGNFEKKIFNICLLFLFVVVAQYYAHTFSRLLRLLTFFVYIYLARCYAVKKLKDEVFLIGISYSTLLLLLLLFWESPLTREFVWNMHFQTNDFFKLLKF